MDEVLSIRELHKQYGSGSRAVHANRGIDLTARGGQVVGLLGHNGAGKTTLVNQVVGILRPDRGSIVLAGTDAVAHPDVARRLTSIQAQANVPITGLTPRTAVRLVGQLRGGRRTDVARRADHLIETLSLGRWADTPAEKVSGGIARLTAFAMTAVVPGRLVVLDEPTNDVDPVRRRLLWDQIRALADAGSAVVLVTHNVREAEHVVDRLVILDRGAVRASGTPAELTGTLAPLSLEVETSAEPTWPSRTVAELRSPGHWTLPVPPDRVVEIVRWADAELRAGRVDRYALDPRSLEDVYVELVGSDEAAA